MADEKKRVPVWLVACAAVLSFVAVVFGFIETVGRQGTIVGRYQAIPGPELRYPPDDPPRYVKISDEEIFNVLGKCDNYHEEPEGISAWFARGTTNATYNDSFHVLPKTTVTGPELLFIPRGVGSSSRMKVAAWQEGPVEVTIAFEADTTDRRSNEPGKWILYSKDLQIKNEHFTWWHLRRWAEEAYTAIHGPRR